jgi:hypothetical protein
LHCPDFAAPAYDEARALFVNNNVTDEQAAALLTQFWQADNNLHRQQWVDQNVQDLADNDAEIARQRLEAQENDLLFAREQENLAKEEMKKNRNKYIQIPDRPMPAVTPIFPSEYAVKKLEKGLYVELWYYTNDGLDDAARSHSAAGDEAMSLLHGADGSITWVSAATVRESKKILDDKDISWDNFTQAVPRMLVAMTNAGWTMERVVMLGQFWGNIQTHELRRSQDPLDQSTLLAYQAKYRLQWHMAITAPGGAFNLAIIDEGRMRAIRDEVYWKDRLQKDNARDCTSFFSHSRLKTACSLHCFHILDTQPINLNAHPPCIVPCAPSPCHAPPSPHPAPCATAYLRHALLPSSLRHAPPSSGCPATDPLRPL